MTIKEKQIKLNDLTINYVESGSGIPIIFYIMGVDFGKVGFIRLIFFLKKIRFTHWIYPVLEVQIHQMMKR